MRIYTELSESEQTQAREQCLTDLLTDITSGGIRFNDELNNDDLQARIDKAGEKAESMRTPWFWSEYIMDTCREELERTALCTAEDSLYPSPDESIIRLKKPKQC